MDENNREIKAFQIANKLMDNLGVTIDDILKSPGVLDTTYVDPFMVRTIRDKVSI